MVDWQGHVKLVDFGVSRKVQDKSTKLRSFVGSPGYVAPDMSCKEGYDYLADIYNVGILIYDLVHGSPPFTYLDPETGLVLPTNSTTLEVDSSLSPELQDLLALLLSRDPAQRLAGSERTGSLLFHPWFRSLPSMADSSSPSPYPPKFLLCEETPAEVEDLAIFEASLRRDDEQTKKLRDRCLIGEQEEVRDEYSWTMLHPGDCAVSKNSDDKLLSSWNSLGLGTGSQLTRAGDIITTERLTSTLDTAEQTITGTVKIFKSRSKLAKENIRQAQTPQ